MIKTISYIHSNKLATYNKLYYENGEVYIGLNNGRLKKLEKSQPLFTQNTNNEDLYSKIFYYNSNSDIILIESYSNGSLVKSKQITYDSSGNVIKISVKEKENYIKEFSYDSDDNIKNINIVR